MRNAEEARKVVEQGQYEKASRQWNDIEKEIEKCIDEGKRYTSFNGTIEKPNKIKLESLGYKVDSGSQYNESYFSVSW